MRLRQCLYVAGVTLTVAGCSLALNSDKVQCNTSDDCVKSGLGEGSTCIANVCVARAVFTPDSGTEDAAPPDPTWGCLGNVNYPNVDKDKPINFKWKFITAQTETPVAALDWSLCSTQDAECTSPLQSGMTDSNGVLNANLYQGIRAYFSLKASPSTSVAALPALFYFKPPDKDVLYDTPETYVHLFTQGEFDALTFIMGAKINPELGHVLGFAFDCQEKPAIGVNTQIATRVPETYGYYSDGNRTPTNTLEETSSYAEAGFLNVPVGITSMTYRRFDEGTRIGAISFMVRKGHITYAPMNPSPL